MKIYHRKEMINISKRIGEVKDIAKSFVQTCGENLPTLTTIYFEKMELMNQGADLKTIIGASAVTIGSLMIGLGYNYKANRAERNIEQFKREFCEILNTIKDKQIENENTINYIKNTLLPITLDSVVNETQSEKIQYIVNGIASTINDESLNFEDITLIYYDILNELRVADIKLLFKIYNKKCETNVTEKNGKFVKTDDEAFDRYILNKLKDKSLITMPVLNGELSGKALGMVYIDSIMITRLGSNFIKFFRVNYKETME